MACKIRGAEDAHHFVRKLEALLQSNRLFAHPHKRFESVSLLVLLLLVCMDALANDAQEFVEDLLLSLETHFRVVLNELFEHQETLLKLGINH